MKKLMYIFGIAALLLAAGCSKDDGWNTPNGIKPVKPSKELTAFFDENLRLISSSLFDEYNEEIGSLVPVYVDTCIMVNSVAEFQAIHLPDGTPMQLTLPPIDFTKYTLVIGQYVLPSGDYVLIGQAVVLEPEPVTMTLAIESTGKGHQMVTVVPFGGLYPKITAESIQTNVVFKK